MFGETIQSTTCVSQFLLLLILTNVLAFVTKSLWILGTAVCCQYLNIFKQSSQVASISRMTASRNILLRAAPSLRLNLAVTDLPHLNAFYWCALLYQAPFCRWPESRASSFIMHFAKREMVELNWYPLEGGCYFTVFLTFKCCHWGHVCRSLMRSVPHLCHIRDLWSLRAAL